MTATQTAASLALAQVNLILAEAEVIALEQRATQLESEVQKFIKLNEELVS